MIFTPKNKILKLKFFTILTLLCIGFSSIVSGASKEPKPAVSDSKQFQDWSYYCEQSDNKENKNKLCYIIQTVSAQAEDAKTKKSSSIKIADYRIGYFNSEKGKPELKMLQTVPLNVAIKPGTALIKNGSEIFAKASYTTCTQNGCTAVLDLSDEMMKKIVSSKSMEIGFILNQKQTNLPLSLNGLSDAFKYLKSQQSSHKEDCGCGQH
jgi:invasion protein IalB